MPTTPQRARHAATGLSDNEKIEYLRVIASMALADGASDEKELARLERLAEILDVPKAIRTAMFLSLRQSRLDAKVTREALVRFKADPALRAAVMMDSIVIAYTDGELAGGESRQLMSLSTALGFSNSEVLEISRTVEKVLFSRDTGHPVEGLTHSLAAVLGHEIGPHGYSWIRALFGG